MPVSSTTTDSPWPVMLAKRGSARKLVEADELVGGGGGIDGGGDDVAGGRPAGGDDLADGVGSGGEVGEGERAVGGGDGDGIAGVEFAVVVEVEEDRAAGDAGVAR